MTSHRSFKNNILSEGMQNVPILAEHGPERHNFEVTDNAYYYDSDKGKTVDEENITPSLRPTLKENWFLCGVVMVILLAYLNPHLGSMNGPLNPDLTVKIAAVSIIFYLSGLSMRTEELTKAIFKYHINMFIQTFSLVITPMAMLLFVSALNKAMDDWLTKGLLTLACMPPPVSSAVLLTKAIGGDEAVAVLNSVLGSFLGIFVSPVSLLFFLGFSTFVPITSTVTQLALTVVFPLMLGQFSRFLIGEKLTKKKALFSVISNLMLLLIIYSTFCDTYIQKSINISWLNFALLLSSELFIQMFTLWALFTICTTNNDVFSPGDTIAVMFCAQHKSLTLGIPMLRLLFNGHASLPLLTIPLLVYHPMQILLGSFLIPPLKSWLQTETKKRLRHTV